MTKRLHANVADERAFVYELAKTGSSIVRLLTDDIEFDHMLEAYVAATYHEDEWAQRTIVLQHGVNREAVRAVWAMANHSLRLLFIAVRTEDERIGPIFDAT